MENAVDALKIAFAVMVFTIALTLAISTFSQARETSEAVLYMNDKTNYYSWEEEVNYTEERIVGIETIIPTLYRYYKENYIVIFEGIDKPIYFLDSTGTWDKNYNGDGNPSNDDDEIYYFDLNSEISRNCPWVGTVNDIKKNLDLFFKGTTLITDDSLKSFGNINRTVKYTGFIEAYKNATFLEQLGEYATDRNYGIETDTEGIKWLVIGSERYRFNSETGMVDADENPKDGTYNKKVSDLLKEKNLDLGIGNNATTKWDEETDWEIIELAKPTIKRVIKYTLQTP